MIKRNQKIEWIKNCSGCNVELAYSTKGNLKRSIERNAKCYSCTHSGKIVSEETKVKIREARKLQSPLSIESRKKLSDSMVKWHSRNVSPMKGKTHTDESIRRIRVGCINHIKSINGIRPNYNPSSIPIIEAKAKELGITDLQHAENGGEFYVKGLGYWVDGYSKEHNLVIEYDEKHHKRQVVADVKRQAEITEHLNCKFIRISE